jgi:DMSO/TMAO reductase YedYZ molybdopterin-dependent catalytic subunit
MPSEVTPNDDFYIISKNFIDPEVSSVGWELTVDGMVEEPYTLSYEELTSLPWVEEFITLECISNSVGGDLISNAKWRGVRLKELLERARLKPGVVDIASFARDGYSESLPLEMALESQVLVAYMMNGEPLPTKHGFPARLIIPGLYGEKCSKWLTRLEAVDHDFLGFWQRNGWSDDARIKTTSQIRVPGKGDRLSHGEILIGGLAFAGDRGISKVEISPDEGDTWLPAIVREPLSPYTWVLWTTEWVPSENGRFKLLVRATDGKGRQQVAEARGTFPDGATGLHSIRVTVTAGESS